MARQAGDRITQRQATRHVKPRRTLPTVTHVPHEGPIKTAHQRVQVRRSRERIAERGPSGQGEREFVARYPAPVHLPPLRPHPNQGRVAVTYGGKLIGPGVPKLTPEELAGRIHIFKASAPARRLSAIRARGLARLGEVQALEPLGRAPSFSEEYLRTLVEPVVRPRLGYPHHKVEVPISPLDVLALPVGGPAVGRIGSGLAKQGLKVALRQAVERRGARIAAARVTATQIGREGLPPVAKAVAQRARVAVARDVAERGALRTTGRIAGRGAGRFTKTGVKASFALSGGTAVATGKPGKFFDPVHGKGPVANVTLRKVGGNPLVNIAHDIIGLPAVTVPAIAMTTQALIAATLQHDGRKAAVLWDGLKNTEAFVALFHGDFGEFLRRLEEHPVYEALMAAGIYGAAGRGANVLAHPGRGAREVARAAPPLPRGAGAATAAGERFYSKNLFTREIQKAIEAPEPAAVAKRSRGEALTKAEGRQVRRYFRRIDRAGAQIENFAAARAGRSLHEIQNRVARTLTQMGRTVGRDMLPLVTMSIERTLRVGTEEADLVKLRAGYNEVAPLLDGEALAANRERVAAINAALGDLVNFDARMHAIHQARDLYEAHQNPVEVELVRRGIIDAERAIRARQRPRQVIHGQARIATRKELRERGRALLEEDPESVEGAALASARTSRLEVPTESPPEGTGLAYEGQPASAPPALDTTDLGGFVSQAPRVEGSGSRIALRPGGISPRRRTGVSTFGGISRADEAQLATTLASREGLNLQHADFEDFIQREALPTRYKTPRDAVRAANNRDLAPGDRYVAINADTGRIIAKRQDTAINHLDAGEGMDLDAISDWTQGIWRQATKPQREGGQWVAVSQRQYERAVLARQPIEENAVSRASQLFKGTVLPWSPNWYLGNFVDITMRGMVAGQLPLNLDPRYRLGRQALEDAMGGPLAAKHTLSGGAAFSEAGLTQQRNFWARVRRTLRPQADEFGSRLADLRRRPSAQAVVDFYRAGQEFMFHWNTQFFESAPFVTGLGRIARARIAATVARTHVDGSAAYADFVNGLKHTVNQEAYAREVAQTFGDWMTMSHRERQTLAHYIPFYMWMRAATKFVFVTLPRDHPILTGMIAASAAATQNERDILGLDVWAPQKAGGPVADYQQGGIPTKGGLFGTQTITSYGVFAQGPLALGRFILPFAEPIMLGAVGVDWKGDALTHSDGTKLDMLERLGAAAYSEVEAFVPFVALANRIAAGGRGHASLPWEYWPDQKRQGLRDQVLNTLLPPSKRRGWASVNKTRAFENPGSKKTGGKKKRRVTFAPGT